LQELSLTSSLAIPDFDDNEQASVRYLGCSSSHPPQEYIIFDGLETKHSDPDPSFVPGTDELSKRHPPLVCASPRKAPSSASAPINSTGSLYSAVLAILI
jgi:hypothetical protein